MTDKKTITKNPTEKWVDSVMTDTDMAEDDLEYLAIGIEKLARAIDVFYMADTDIDPSSLAPLEEYAVRLSRAANATFKSSMDDDSGKLD